MGIGEVLFLDLGDRDDLVLVYRRPFERERERESILGIFLERD